MTAAAGELERVNRLWDGSIDAVIFDLDGVVTETAEIHAAAWKKVFDDYLKQHAASRDQEFRAFTDEDYGRYVDGKPRYEGADSFLRSRGIELPFGEQSDDPGYETVCAIGNLKNGIFRQVLRHQGAQAYQTSIRLIHRLKEQNIDTAAITSSRNGRHVLDAAGVTDLFAAVVDGVDAQRKGLAGKPEPDVFLEAARQLNAPPKRTAVVEDAQAGVEAGQRGSFGLIVGVDRLGRAQALSDAGADIVVSDLSELMPTQDESQHSMLADLPSALESVEGIVGRLVQGQPVIFLDYDGTLAPIVDDPELAEMPPAVRHAVERLARLAPVAVVSGRALDDVRRRARLDGVYYAGSHGFEIEGPDGRPLAENRAERFERFLPTLDEAEELLHELLDGEHGVTVERKPYAIALHYRQAGRDAEGVVQRAVNRVQQRLDGMRKTGGKKIFELRPDIDWDKGRALELLLEVLPPGSSKSAPLFIGDDETDEDALRVVRDRGVGVVVRGEDERPTLAHYAVDDPEQAGALLNQIADELATRSPR